eukprot:SAG31_NODE_726_length_12541_cov_4.922922_5_plen_370_part_00
MWLLQLECESQVSAMKVAKKKQKKKQKKKARQQAKADFPIDIATTATTSATKDTASSHHELTIGPNRNGTADNGQKFTAESDSSDVSALLDRLGFGRHIATCVDNEMDLAALEISTVADLEEIGLPLADARMLVSAIGENSSADNVTSIQVACDVDPHGETTFAGQQPIAEQLLKEDMESIEQIELANGNTKSASAKLVVSNLGPMGDFGTAEAVLWLRTVPGISDIQVAAVAEKFIAEEYDGEELALAKNKSLRRILRYTVAVESVSTILCARDAYIEAEKGHTTLEATKAETSSCTICFEEYDSSSIIPRILVECGHSFCEHCLFLMLRPLPAKNGFKQLECPVCKTPCPVPRGSAAKLPKNFAIFE